MSAANVPLTIEQGVTFNSVVTVKASNGSFQDLTGYSARMQVRKSPNSAAPILSLTSPVVAGLGIAVGTTDGTLTVKIPAANTAALDFYVCYYDLEIVSPAGDVTRVLQGKVSLSREVTK